MKVISQNFEIWNISRKARRLAANTIEAEGSDDLSVYTEELGRLKDKYYIYLSYESDKEVIEVSGRKLKRLYTVKRRGKDMKPITRYYCKY